MLFLPRKTFEIIYYFRFSFSCEIRELEKNEFWVPGLDEVVTDGFNLNEMVINSEDTSTKTNHSYKETSWERYIRLRVCELKSKNHWISVILGAATSIFQKEAKSL